jgi:hypothetical protein
MNKLSNNLANLPLNSPKSSLKSQKQQKVAFKYVLEPPKKEKNKKTYTA